MDKFLLLFALLLPSIVVEVQAIRRSHKPQAINVKLFVFGDSYADTGNTPTVFSYAWKQPYGMTYPGKPIGRFSDGRVLTDYVAEFFNITSPVPYEQRKSEDKSIQHGMNFAYGGTGVFNTLIPLPNMTIQINYLQQLLEQKVYTKNDLESSIALISTAGNDYSAYLRTKGSKKRLPSFSKKVVDQIALNLKRIHDLGVRKIGVVAIEPLGCLPRFTMPSYLRCNKNLDLAAKSHNLMLHRAVHKLRKENKRSVFSILNLYNAFASALNRPGYSLRPCCLAVGKGNKCSSVDDRGVKKYTVCKDPSSAFFWDRVHPAQHGWCVVYSILRSSLQKLQ